MQNTKFPNASWEQYSDKIISALSLKKTAIGEYHGACPVCQGEDRFWIKETSNSEIMVTCRKCSDYAGIKDALRRQAEGKEDIWVVFGNVIEGESMGLPKADGGPVEAVILDFSVGVALAGGRGYGNTLFVDWVFTNDSCPAVGRVIDSYSSAEFNIAGFIPIENAKGSVVG